MQLANVPQSCQWIWPYFSWVSSALTNWLYTVAELIASPINNLKLMAGGQAASYFIDHSFHSPYILYGERADPQRAGQ